MSTELRVWDNECLCMQASGWRSLGLKRRGRREEPRRPPRKAFNRKERKEKRTPQIAQNTQIGRSLSD